MEIENDAIGEVGCHLTWPELLKITQEQLERSWNSLETRKVEFSELPTYYCSIKNLQGFILYSLNDQKTAEEKFDEIMELDPNNIIATGNLAVLYRRQSKLKLFHEFIKKLQKLLSDRDPVYLARAYADRAHAIRHFEQDVRPFSYTAFIKKAVEIGAETDVPEKAEWIFDYGLALYRRDSQLVAGQAAMAVTEPSFKEAIVCFASVTEMVDAPPAYRALSWVFMGILLRTKTSRSLGQALLDTTHLHSYTSMDCYEQALSLQPDHHIVLRRVASELTLMKQFDRAEKMFQKSIEKEASWFGHRHLGLLYLAMYEDDYGNDSKVTSEQLSLLAKAQEQFQTALKFKQVHADHSDLGYIAFLRGDYDTAVQEFSLAVRSSHDDNFDIVETHSRWARCLKKMGEEEGALLQLSEVQKAQKRLQKQVEILRNIFTHNHGINCCGFECDLSRFDYCSSERQGFVNILSENQCAYINPLSPLLHRQPSSYKFDFFVSFTHIDHKWTVSFVKRLEKDFDVRGCIRYRDYAYGATIAENIAENIDESYRIILILSPDSLRDHWCRYELQRAHIETLKRRCIVPVLLRTCKLPREVENLTHIKCNRGQFALEDWYRLRETLRQDEKKTKMNLDS
ncbi:uncharacterized protein LOC129274564 [Lytechinus pictus]|uniref:uncharacterized protein LOC129274564 n=1 Tax=Lytechinus pictus TaxID=7653 RepID=UPI0030B9DEA7